MDARFDDLSAIIRHPKSHRVLLREGRDGWMLPGATVALMPTDHRWRDTVRVNRAISYALGITVTTRECVHVSPYPAAGEHGVTVFVMETHGADGIIPGHGEWLNREDIDRAPFAVPAHRALLRDWLTRASQRDTTRLPWMEEGWFDEAVEWIHAQLDAQSLFRTGPVEQMRAWFLSAILRVPTATGDVYFKAAPPIYAHEPGLTRAVAALAPGLAPQVLAVDRERRWLLMKGIAGVKLRDYPATDEYVARWETILQAFARLQQTGIAQVDSFLDLGCPDWRPAALAPAITSLLTELPALLDGADDPLTSAEMANLHAIAPYLRAVCTNLAATPLPASLHHGDFHSGNILANEHENRLIDWAGFVGVAHPFLSLLVPLEEEHRDPSVRDHLRNVYLREWRAWAPLDQLQAAAILAQPIAAFCGALGHRNQLVHTRMDVPWDRRGEQENMVLCLRRMLTLCPVV